MKQVRGTKACVQIRFTNEYIEILRNNIPLDRHVVRMSQKDSTVQNNNRSFTLPVMGLDPAIEEIWNLDVEQGRFLDDADNLSHGLFAVIGSASRDKLFSGLPAINESISIDGLTFHVIGTITLGIGGVGLMNIMLVSVTQRTREIGVEKALGARRHHILFQFLAEAMVITAVGGVLGILLSYVVSLSVGRLTLYSALAKHAEAGDIRLIVSPMILVVATTILTVLGVISVMGPTIHPANLKPIQALRYE